jgi:predicted TIM-barrel fold metal-dependent hydrolase
MHHWQHSHFAELAPPAGFSPLDEYSIDAHLGELREVERIQVDLVVCVQLSLTDKPDHVLDALGGTDSAAARGAQASLRDAETRKLGIVAASPDRLHDGSLDHERVAGVRLMLGAKGPEALEGENSVASDAWKPLLRKLETTGKHFTTMCTNKETAVRLLELVPASIPVGFDHLALGHDETDPEEDGFRKLLQVARERGNVYFKGPGYRTSLDPEPVAPMIGAIIRTCGPEAVLLGATDAPHVWTEPGTDEPMRSHFPHQTRVVEYVGELANLVIAEVRDDYPDVSPDALLSENALAAYERLLG